MPQYNLRDIPPTLWHAFTERAGREQWPLRALVLQLIQDYADGKIHPSTPRPAQMPEYAWLRPHFREMQKAPNTKQGNLVPLPEWDRLTWQVYPHDVMAATQMRTYPEDLRRSILRWLHETAEMEETKPKGLLTMRVIGHIGSGPSLTVDRRPYQYEVIGLPPGQQAWIADYNHAWRILRAVNGEHLGDWAGSYPTAQDALKALENIVFAGG